MKGKARAGEGGAGGPREDPVSRPDFQVPPFPNLGRRDDGEPSRRGDQGSRGAEGGGEQTQVNPPERVEGMPAVYLTPYGAKYHTSYNCRSLRNSRNLRRSDWCPMCARMAPNDMPAWIYSQGPGRDAHINMLCIGAQGGSRYDRCGLCVR